MKINLIYEESYFGFFNKYCEENSNKRMIVEKVNEILISMAFLIKKVDYTNCFDTIGKLIGLDSKLQLLILLDSYNELSETKIIELAEDDYIKYYEESLDFQSINDAPSLQNLIK